MQEQINNILENALNNIKRSQTAAQIGEIRKDAFGKSGSFTNLLRALREVSAEERPMIGMLINNARARLESELDEREQYFKEQELNASLLANSIDISIPAPKLNVGSLHPVTIIRNRLTEFFTSFGYSLEDGREVETDYYNFEALNIPSDHPARESQDTFFITNNILLRSQTSNAQIHVMEKTKPPIKMICPGRVYRGDDADATHSPVFHQLEGLVVDKNVTMCNLKSTLESMCKFIFGSNTRTRFRPSFFPFTEPSVEVDASCGCGGAGCKICKGTGWIELLGAGMVNRRVLKNCGINPDEYSGFAFGVGLDRVASLVFSIPDLRLFFENDVRFLKQF